MPEIIMEKEVKFRMSDVEENGGLVRGIIHSIAIDDEEPSEEGAFNEYGILTISIENSKYQQSDFTIWSDGVNFDNSNAYVHFPTMLKEDESEDIDLDDIVGDELKEMINTLERKEERGHELTDEEYLDMQNICFVLHKLGRI